MMRKYILSFLVVLFFASCGSSNKDYGQIYTKDSKIDVSDAKVSPFVGQWKWVEYDVDKGECILVDIGERNDSLMVALNCVLNGARFVASSDYDANDKQIPDICIAAPGCGNTVQGVFSPKNSIMKNNPPFESVSMRLTDKNTLVVEVTRGSATHYFPRQSVYKREGEMNREFSHRLYYVYVDSVMVK